MSRIEKTRQKPPQKQRRSSKKLVADLESIADALPETGEEQRQTDVQANVIRQKTLKHKPGATKRKEKLEKLEKDRFARNMAQMAGNSTDANSEQNAIPDRWAALRGFISQTMEHQPAFKPKP